MATKTGSKRSARTSKSNSAKASTTTSRAKKNQPNVPSQFDWRTTDEQEILKRRQRALEDPPKIRNLQPSFRIYSDFQVTSSSGMTYYVEIHDLAQRKFFCTSPDFQHNGLGTCKHTEAVLLYLESRWPRLFKQAQKNPSPRIDVTLNATGDNLSLQTNAAQRPRQFAKYFDREGLLLSDADPEEAVQMAKSLDNEAVRVSREVDIWLEKRRRAEESVALQRDYETKVRSGEYPAHETSSPLFPYQREGMLFLAFRERALLADEMGLGKTIQAIAAASLLHRLGKAKRCLVVTPASLKVEWEEQIERFTSLTCQLVFGGRNQRGSIYAYPESFFILTNYEQIRTDSLDINEKLKPDIVILDEAQRIKNWSSKTARAVKRLQSRYAFVLTGTPIENRIDEIYSIVDFLDPSVFGPLFRFNRDFYQLNDRGRPEGYKNLDTLADRVAPLMLRRRKSDVETELPERTLTNRFVEMSQPQRELHEEIKKEVAKLVLTAKRRALTKKEQEYLQLLLAKMRMACDTLYILDDLERDCPKLDEINSILSTVLEDGATKVIIFSEWVRMLDLVRETLETNGIHYALHTGSVSQKRRRTEIRMFKDDPDCRVFLCSESGGVGLNLQNASVVINCDLPWNPAKLEQRIARAWRKGQRQAVSVINLISEDTIESRMLETLRNKQALAQGIIDRLDAESDISFTGGAQSFLSRLEQTLQLADKRPKPTRRAPNDPGAAFASDLRKQIGDQLVECEERWPSNQESPAYYIVLDSQSTRQNLTSLVEKRFQEYFAELEASGGLIIVDKSSAQAIDQLVESGLLQRNYRAKRDLLRAETSKPRDLSEAEISQLKERVEHLDKKLKTARILLPEGLIDEAIPALNEALRLTLTSRALIMGVEAPNGTFEPSALDSITLLSPEEKSTLTAFQNDPSPNASNALNTLLKASQDLKLDFASNGSSGRFQAPSNPAQSA